MCTEEDLRNGGRFFDFDLQLVERALQDDKSAFEMLCEKLCAKLDQIEAKIAQLCPGWSSEHLERVRDLFVHDRFLRLFTNPPKDKIEDFNALCWKFLYDSIVDAWRFYRRPKRNFQVEVSADITDPTAQRDFWETHGTEIVSNPTRLPCDQAEVSDLMAYMGHCLDLMSPKKRNKIMDAGLFGEGDRGIFRHDHGKCREHCQQDYSGPKGKTTQENGMKYRQRFCGAYSK